MKKKTIKPPKLKYGDLIDIISPASSPKNISMLEKGIQFLKNKRFKVNVSEYYLERVGYLAGDDEKRYKDLKDALLSNSNAVLCTRGGYGCARLMPFLEEKYIPFSPKVFMGYSDITTLNLYLYKKYNLITYYGPMVGVEFGKDDFEKSFTWKYFKYFIEKNPDNFKIPDLPYMKMEPLIKGKAEGILIGGCLCIIEGLIGTPYEPDWNGKILFLEEVGEPVYKIDRMLMHFANVGIFEKVSGIIIGECVDCEKKEDIIKLKDVFYGIFKRYNKPVIINAPFGHGDEKIIFPNGINCYMNADNNEIYFKEKIWEN